jgi:hypothetical protein
MDDLRGTVAGIPAISPWLYFSVLVILWSFLPTLGPYFLSKMEAD